ncbi:head-tail joining protein [Paraburkholderia sp. MM6662-R1]|uniref:head-tail joining protein n=1 Tax=Paraburkholderia sp. MM6662-R1 TaxID=2991066 RepID=UPI003D1924D1
MIDWDSLVLTPVEGIFGQPATLYAGSGNAHALNGVFDEAFTNVDVVDGVPVTTTRPCYGFRVATLPVTAHQGDTLFIPAAPGAPLSDTTYVVREVRTDGHGWCFLLLNLAT